MNFREYLKESKGGTFNVNTMPPKKLRYVDSFNYKGRKMVIVPDKPRIGTGNEDIVYVIYDYKTGQKVTSGDNQWYKPELAKKEGLKSLGFMQGLDIQLNKLKERN